MLWRCPTSSTLRICHLADVHLGYRRYTRLSEAGVNQREVDVGVAFREACERVVRIRPDLVIIAGDLFHSVRPSNLSLTHGFREIKKLSAALKAPIVIIAGNHESPKRTDTGSVLRLFSEIEHVHIADNAAEKFTFSAINCSVLAVPHAALEELEGISLRADDRFRFNVLVTHAQVGEKWLTDFGGVSLALQQLAPQEWDYIALGHLHFNRDVGLKGAYSGSTEYTSANIWSESKEKKGFLEVSLPEGKRTFHALTSPREVIELEPIDGFGRDPAVLTAQIIERLQGVGGGVEGKIIRLVLENVERSTFRALDHKELRSWRTRALNFTLDVRTPERTSSAMLSRQRSDLKTDLTAFISQSLPPLEAEQVSKLIAEQWDSLEETKDTVPQP